MTLLLQMQATSPTTGLAHHQIVNMYNFWQSIVQEEFKPAPSAADLSGCLIGNSQAA